MATHVAAPAPAATRDALAGIRVVELGFAAAGPLVGKYLADHGAEVIHVESRSAPDVFRTAYPPFKDNVEGLDRAAMFAFYNDGKRSFTLDLKAARAIDVLRRLIAKTDVVIESFPAGTMRRRGLDYAALSADHPGLVMLSSCNQGQTGPHAAHPGYGSQLTALAGFNQLLGEPGRSPVLLYGPYIDYIAVGYGVVAIMAALRRRRRTGRGGYIDLSQLEAGLQFMTPALLELQSTGRVPDRAGNTDRVAAPHGVYPANGTEKWIALSVWSDDEWTRFGDVTGVRGDRRAADVDERIAGWTRARSREDAVAALRARGLRAAPVLSISELFADPQLAHRGAFPEVEHPVLRGMHAMAPPWLLSATPPRLERGGPIFGADNAHVLHDILGLDDAEIASLEAEGTFR